MTFIATAPGAVAATPKAGTFVQLKNNRELMRINVQKGHVTDAVHYDSCVRVPIFTSSPNIKISGGNFNWTGKVTDVINHKWQVHVDGTFVSPTKAKGHWSAKQLSGGSCTSTYTYTVTRQA
jgi:hypothetical protein